MLWSAAIGVGAVGLLLLAIAGVAAMVLSSRAQHRSVTRSQGTPAYGESPHRTQQPLYTRGPADQRSIEGDLPEADHPADRVVGGALLAWLKAWVFAFVHAGAVSFVLGGVTFFEDLVRANEEIQHTGTVTFPKRLLPGAFSGPETPHSLNHRADEGVPFDGATARYRVHEDGPTGRDRPTFSGIETAEWKVVDILDEAGPAGEALAGDYRPSR